jgi:hypothetical protein
MRTGRTYLMVDPSEDSDRALDLHRVLARRVRVQLVKIHILSLRRRYEVVYNGETYRTGRLFTPKRAA